MLSELTKFLNPEYLITLVASLALPGYLLLFFIVFAESGLFFGFFFPGDSLLFLAGVFAAQGALNYPVLLILCVLGAILGDNVGYLFGKSVGQRLYSRPNSKIFRKDHLEAASAFYHRHGGKAIVLARFMPMVRTFTPIVAGAANMDYRMFVKFNVVGGLLWGAGMVTAGYFFGNLIPKGEIDKFLLPVIVLIIIVSLLPALLHAFNSRHTHR